MCVPCATAIPCSCGCQSSFPPWGTWRFVFPGGLFWRLRWLFFWVWPCFSSFPATGGFPAGAPRFYGGLDRHGAGDDSDPVLPGQGGCFVPGHWPPAHGLHGRAYPGSLAVNQEMKRAGEREQRWWGPTILGGFFLLTSGMAALIGGSVSLGLWGDGVAAGCLGVFCAAVFSQASLYRVGSQEGIIAPLYGADLLGGCLASVSGRLGVGAASGSRCDGLPDDRVLFAGVFACSDWISVL